jgi:hypothetical protein
MKASVLFSSGKDSSLAAILMEPFFDIELVTINFGILPTHKFSKETADKLGFPIKVVRLEPHLIEEAAKMLIGDGYPKRAINFLHHTSLQVICSQPDTVVVADGIRRDDRVPMLTKEQIRSLEDTYNISYIRPLMGYGRSCVNILVKEHLKIVEGESEKIEKSDYEVELRSFIRKQYNKGDSIVKSLFPEHIQSHVISRKNS